MPIKLALSWLASAALMFFANAATAEKFDDALDAWLADNDYAAIPALAGLARTGNTDAQLLLGVIVTRPHSPYVLNLARSDRIAQLRAPGGLSGKSWLKVAAKVGDMRAKALVAVQTPPFETNAISTLLKLGEDDAAATTMLRAAAYRRTDPNAAIFDKDLPPDMAYASTILKLSASLDQGHLDWRPGDDPLKLVEVLAADAFLYRRLDNGPTKDLSLRLFPGLFRGTDALPAGEFLLSIAPVSRPANRLRTYCTAACPKDIETCAGDAVALLGGYNQIWRFGPPITALVSEDRYLKSPRFHADMARQIKGLMGGWSLALQSAWSKKSCAAASRFRSRFP